MIDLSLNEEQRQIVAAASELLEVHYPLERIQSADSTTDVHARLVEWGWFGVGVEADAGGFGLGVPEEVLLYFEAGRFLLPLSVLATTLAVHLARGDARAELLSGARRGAIAMRVRSHSLYVFDRSDASDLVVFEDGSIRLAPANTFLGEQVDSFDEAIVLEHGELIKNIPETNQSCDRATLLVAAMLAGISRTTCDLAVEYAKVREQFGQSIGAFQAIKHLCADMGLRAYAAEAQVKVAGATAADDPTSSEFEAYAAAATALEAAIKNAEAAIQIHGGIGFTAECNVHAYLKRAHILGRLIGGRERQLKKLLALEPPGWDLHASPIAYGEAP